MVDGRVRKPAEQQLKVLGKLLEHWEHLAVDVGPEQWAPGERARLQVDHAASAHSGRLKGQGQVSCLVTFAGAQATNGAYGSLREVHGLEDHAHGRRHLNDLAAHETQLLVVVQHRVHVLDPDGVDGAVEDDPLAVRCVLLGKRSEDARQHTVAPLETCQKVKVVNAG